MAMMLRCAVQCPLGGVLSMTVKLRWLQMQLIAVRKTGCCIEVSEPPLIPRFSSFPELNPDSSLYAASRFTMSMNGHLV